jgi:pyrimidine oxygenase
VELGVFIPIAGRFIMSTNSPKAEPTWEHNRDVTVLAEEVGLDFSMSMIKLHGFGGETRFWNEGLDSIALMAGLAAATTKIRVLATVPMLAVHPAVAARQSVTINQISGGRFGLNLVTGWSPGEYAPYGLWPGDSHFRDRYDYATEYTQILRDFWSTGESNFKGKYFQMDGAEVLPMPEGGHIPIVCAGRSGKGLEFTARFGDWSFINGSFDRLADAKEEVLAAAAKAGRQVKTLPVLHLVMGATDAEAHERLRHIEEGADIEAIENMRRDMKQNAKPGATGGTAESALKQSLFVGTEPLVGGYDTVAKKLRELDEQGFDGAMMQCTDYLEDVRNLAEHVFPRIGREPAAA